MEGGKGMLYQVGEVEIGGAGKRGKLGREKRLEKQSWRQVRRKNKEGDGGCKDINNCRLGMEPFFAFYQKKPVHVCKKFRFLA